MISGYWCKLRQVPLKVLPFCRVPVKFIGYLTRPLGFFFVSVDTEKSSKPSSEKVPRRSGRIWELTFAEFCGIQRLSAIDALWEYIVECFFGCWNSTFIRVNEWLILPSRWEYMKSYLYNSKYAHHTLYNFIGHANSVPDGSSPRGYSQGLVLGCRLPQFLYLSYSKIYFFLK